MKGSEATSRAVISQILNKHLTPLLKRHGFVKRGGRRYLRHLGEDRIDVIEIQADKWGGGFLVGVGIIFPAIESILERRIDSDGPHFYGCPVNRRVTNDFWRFDASTDIEAFGAMTAAEVESKGLGFFERLPTAQSIVDAAVAKEIWAYPFWVVALAAHAGNRAQAQDLLERTVAEAEPGEELLFYRRMAYKLAQALGLDFAEPPDEVGVHVKFQIRPDLRDAFFFHVHGELRRALGDGQYQQNMTGHEDRSITVWLYGPDAAALREAAEAVAARFPDEVTSTSFE